MSDTRRRNWRELCQSVANTRDRDEVLRLVQELNQTLEAENRLSVILRGQLEQDSLMRGDDADN
jgi:hypothetical protein